METIRWKLKRQGHFPNRWPSPPHKKITGAWGASILLCLPHKFSNNHITICYLTTKTVWQTIRSMRVGECCCFCRFPVSIKLELFLFLTVFISGFKSRQLLQYVRNLFNHNCNTLNFENMEEKYLVSGVEWGIPSAAFAALSASPWSAVNLPYKINNFKMVFLQIYICTDCQYFFNFWKTKENVHPLKKDIMGWMPPIPPGIAWSSWSSTFVTSIHEVSKSKFNSNVIVTSNVNAMCFAGTSLRLSIRFDMCRSHATKTAETPAKKIHVTPPHIMVYYCVWNNNLVLFLL